MALYDLISLASGQDSTPWGNRDSPSRWPTQKRNRYGPPASRTGLCANAAKLLYETLTTERDIAQQQYVGPLKERVRQLGRYIFNESFDVEIDNELRVTQRTLNGRTLPFESLSTGAREQIGLLMRLAAALLADSAGGVPVVLDDTLGSTDRSRLEGAGVAITVAARDCQVILLTSMPERYQHIDISQSVRLT